MPCTPCQHIVSSYTYHKEEISYKDETQEITDDTETPEHYKTPEQHRDKYVTNEKTGSQNAEFAFVKSVNQANDFSLSSARVVIDQSSNGKKASQDFLIRTLKDGSQYVYKSQKGHENFILALFITIGHVFNNIIRKCIVPLVFSFVMFTKGDCCKKLRETVSRDLKNLMPLRALVALVANLVLDALSILSFGLASNDFNKLSGDVERWAAGDTLADTWGKRISKGSFGCHSDCFFLFSRYVAPCQQPLFRLGDDADNKAIQLGYSDDAITPYIPESQRSAYMRTMIQGNQEIRIGVVKSVPPPDDSEA